MGCARWLLLAGVLVLRDEAQNQTSLPDFSDFKIMPFEDENIPAPEILFPF